MPAGRISIRNRRAAGARGGGVMTGVVARRIVAMAGVTGPRVAIGPGANGHGAAADAGNSRADARAPATRKPVGGALRMTAVARRHSEPVRRGAGPVMASGQSADGTARHGGIVHPGSM